MHPSLPTSVSHISWSHVGFGLAFIGFNSAISQVLQLQIGGSLVIAALRCVAQLTVVGAVLQHVLAVKKPWTVAGIARTFFLRGVILVMCDSALTYSSVAEHARYVRNWCVDSFETVISALVLLSRIFNYVSHHQGANKISIHGEWVRTPIIFWYSMNMRIYFSFSYLALSFPGPVSGRARGYARVNDPCVYRGRTLDNECCPVLDTRTISLVTIPFSGPSCS